MTSLALDPALRARVTASLDALDVTEAFDLAEVTNDATTACLRWLLARPERWQRVVADPSLITAVVDGVPASASARLEARIALEELARRAPTLRIARPESDGGLWVELL